MRSAFDYEYMAYRPYKSLQEKQKLVLGRKFGKDPTSLYPFRKLKIDQLKQELGSRKMNTYGKQPAIHSRLVKNLEVLFDYLPSCLERTTSL